MILIVGGAYQGKASYAELHYGESHRIVGQYHLVVRKELAAGKCPMEAAKRLLETAKNDGSFDRLVVVSDEIGYGVVPVDAFERKYREANGRVNCYFAEEAQQVFRVIAGVAQCIKQE